MKIPVCTGVMTALLVIGGCAVQPSRPGHAGGWHGYKSVRQRVVDVRQHLSRFRSEVGHWSNGQVSSTYKAYFSDSAPVYIVETAAGKQTGSYAVNKYYYAAGSLLYYHGHGSVPGGIGLVSHPVELDTQLVFTFKGRLAKK